MEFGLTLDQRMLQESLQGALDKACPLDRVRTAAAAPETLARDVWQTIADLGVAGVLVPEEYGGLGLTLLDAALASEMLGRSVAPTPFSASCVMAPLALVGAGSKAQQSAWLPKLASGEIIAAVAIAEHASGARDGAGVTASNGKLSGVALFVLDIVGADIIIVADKAKGLHLVRADAAGLTKTALPAIDRTRPIGELRFDNVDAEPLGAGDAAKTLRDMIDCGRVALAADSLGAGGAMIAKAVAYALERKQFGRVIGSFQAVKHMCAEMAAELEPCRSLLWYAAYARAAAPERFTSLASHAKAHLSEIGQFIARTSTEVHGGMGFTDLVGLHFWFKRLGFNRQMLGGPERVRHDAAIAQGWVAA